MSRKLPKAISKDSMSKMLNQLNVECATGCRNYAILMTFYRAGLRVSELCNLALSDVNFETELIYVQSGKGAKDRYIPMDADVITTAKSWLQIRPESEFFFCTHKGGQLDTRYIREMCYRISEKARVFIQDGREKKKVSPHKLRHSFATDLLKSGDFNIREVQELLGHSSISTTQIYTHVTIDEMAKKFKNRARIGR